MEDPSNVEKPNRNPFNPDALIRWYHLMLDIEDKRAYSTIKWITKSSGYTPAPVVSLQHVATASVFDPLSFGVVSGAFGLEPMYLPYPMSPPLINLPVVYRQPDGSPGDMIYLPDHLGLTFDEFLWIIGPASYLPNYVKGHNYQGYNIPPIPPKDVADHIAQVLAAHGVSPVPGLDDADRPWLQPNYGLDVLYASAP